MPVDKHVPHESHHDENIAEEIEAGVGADNAAIDDVDETPALNSTFSDTEVETELAAHAVAINAILAALRNNGIVLPSE